VDHRGLGDVVDAEPESGADAAHARHVDDRAAVLAHVPVDGELGQRENAADVDVEGLVPGAQVGVEAVPEVRVGGGVVDQDVDPAVPVERRADQPLELVRLSGVGSERHRGVRTDGVETFGLGVEVRLLAAREHDFGAPLDERVGDGAADAAACAGDNRNPVLKVVLRHRW